MRLTEAGSGGNDDSNETSKISQTCRISSKSCSKATLYNIEGLRESFYIDIKTIIVKISFLKKDKLLRNKIKNVLELYNDELHLSCKK